MKRTKAIEDTRRWSLAMMNNQLLSRPYWRLNEAQKSWLLCKTAYSVAHKTTPIWNRWSYGPKTSNWIRANIVKTSNQTGTKHDGHLDHRRTFLCDRGIFFFSFFLLKLSSRKQRAWIVFDFPRIVRFFLAKRHRQFAFRFATDRCWLPRRLPNSLFM